MDPGDSRLPVNGRFTFPLVFNNNQWTWIDLGRLPLELLLHLSKFLDNKSLLNLSIAWKWFLHTLATPFDPSNVARRTLEPFFYSRQDFQFFLECQFQENVMTYQWIQSKFIPLLRRQLFAMALKTWLNLVDQAAPHGFPISCSVSLPREIPREWMVRIPKLSRGARRMVQFTVSLKNGTDVENADVRETFRLLRETSVLSGLQLQLISELEDIVMEALAVNSGSWKTVIFTGSYGSVTMASTKLMVALLESKLSCISFQEVGFENGIDWHAVQAALQRNQHLNILCLRRVRSQSVSGSLNVSVLAKGICGHPYLRSLNLEGNAVDVEGMKSLVDAISNHSNLRQLVMDRCTVDSQSCILLANTLRAYPCKLDALSWRNCGWEEDVVVHWIHLFRDQPRLRSLDLRENQIRDRAALETYALVDEHGFQWKIDIQTRERYCDRFEVKVMGKPLTTAKDRILLLNMDADHLSFEVRDLFYP